MVADIQACLINGHYILLYNIFFRPVDRLISAIKSVTPSEWLCQIEMHIQLAALKPVV